VTIHSEEAAKSTLTLMKGLFMHFGYPGRRATADNLAFPLSPSEITILDQNGRYVSTVIAGTRDPYFQKSLDQIKADVMEIVKRDYEDLARQCEIEILIGTRKEPILFLDSVENTLEEAIKIHREEIAKLEPFLVPGRPSMLELHPAEAFVWGMYHLFTDSEKIRETMFPITHYNCNGGTFQLMGKTRPEFQDIGLSDCEYSLDPEKVDNIEKVEHTGEPVSRKPLGEMAHVIRSKDAGVNKITFDVFFITPEDYQTALQSGLFSRENMAGLLSVPVADVIGTYRADTFYAVKVSLHRCSISGNPGEKDIFGAQQHMRLLMMDIPIYQKP